MIRRPPRSTLFPFTTRCRSVTKGLASVCPSISRLLGSLPSSSARRANNSAPDAVGIGRPDSENIPASVSPSSMRRPSAAGTGDCTCYQSACYFKCTKDIDCASGSTCDTTTSLCKKSGCTTAGDCVQSTGNPLAQCNAGACQIACTNDVECAPPSTICASGFCKAAGCSSDANCTSSTHLFCVTATSTTYTSAVTN